mmetsp:Transcript_49454/g.107993  ORF Transcript_49454/g.107993 Transcript_49454/m.107993 type:complete len:355 (+) Transcript_49454:47-1111(+)
MRGTEDARVEPTAWRGRPGSRPGTSASTRFAPSSPSEAKEDDLGLPALQVIRLEDSETMWTKMQRLGNDPAFSQFNCPICFETFWRPVRTICGHRFCQECLLMTILSQLTSTTTAKPSCPICRHALRVEKKLDTEGDFPLDGTLMSEMKILMAQRERGNLGSRNASRAKPVSRGKQPQRLARGRAARGVEQLGLPLQKDVEARRGGRHEPDVDFPAKTPIQAWGGAVLASRGGTPRGGRGRAQHGDLGLVGMSMGPVGRPTSRGDQSIRSLRRQPLEEALPATPSGSTRSRGLRAAEGRKRPGGGRDSPASRGIVRLTSDSGSPAVTQAWGSAMHRFDAGLEAVPRVYVAGGVD